MEEIWKPIDGYEKYYVSNYGRVKSFCSGKEKILKPELLNGYLRVKLYKAGKPKKIFVHRLVAQTFLPNPDNKPQINHIKSQCQADCRASLVHQRKPRRFKPKAVRANIRNYSSGNRFYSAW